VLTSSAQRGEAERSQQAGIVAYLTKPVLAARLRGALDIALGAGVDISPNLSRIRSPDLALRSPGSTDDCVLVVEDHVVNQRVLTTMLASLGYRADVAANGVEALEAVRRHRYAAVFMDCQMPVMDGYEATEKLRQSEGTDRRTCVIAVTATAMAADRERCLAVGMDDYLAKPINLTSLAAVLARWVPRQSGPGIAAGPAQPAADTNGAATASALDAQVVARLERLGEAAGEDLMGELSTLFLADADIRLLAMRVAFAGDDGAAIVGSAHALTGASANVGATALAGLCATLEADCAAGNLAAGQARLDALEAELGRVRSALNSRTRTP
jgi:two-component system sensor histidine kinase/response regulator